jgi:hypothetical protein
MPGPNIVAANIDTAIFLVIHASPGAPQSRGNANVHAPAVVALFVSCENFHKTDNCFRTRE